ncbi:hypothetical protein GEU84_005780 [Fertoebacter nigrum]|uniref:Uncharacterized protein n=1 Tax=Fertoeibacter niger TaxID=2656921 RepID=A0A8X8KQB5_9RHOB|nr:hypothetical protein [Fertoeibacter niger]NUB43882.1 hypothetical protein [Fertoeibacter niger]
MTTIFFIVDGPALEAQATLLAATLAHHNGRRFAYAAYVPARHRAALRPATRSLFERCGVALRALPEPAQPWRVAYPHGNKILAAADRRAGDWGLFLDTDMICTAPLDLASLQRPGHVGLLPEGVPSWGRTGDRWERAYAHFGLPMPTERVQLTRRRRISFLPYFNAGFVLMPEGDVADGRSFGQLWLDTALDFDWKAEVGGKRPWLDQITLPLVLKRFGLGYHLVPVEYNFSVSARAHEPGAAPVIMHYHRWGYTNGWPQRELALEALAMQAGPALRAELEAEFGAFYTMTTVEKG